MATKLKNISIIFLISAYSSIFSTVVWADTQYIQCTYLLERWKINDLAEYASCPSGERGLGKPWRVDTYAFDLEKGAVSDASITQSSCFSDVETVIVKLTVLPDQLIFRKNKGVSVISRETLKDESGSQCELKQKKAEKNKI